VLTIITQQYIHFCQKGKYRRFTIVASQEEPIGRYDIIVFYRLILSPLIILWYIWAPPIVKSAILGRLGFDFRHRWCDLVALLFP
jgi:hypothetical protein